MGKIVRAEKFYNRNEVANDTKSMYIFTDNTDRDSGRGEIPEDSWYCLKYGSGKHHPSVTSATQRWYNSERKGIFGRWKDRNIETFKRVIDDDFDEIEKNMGRYERIVFPVGGIFNSKIANISKSRVPELYEYLMNKCLELRRKYES